MIISRMMIMFHKKFWIIMITRNYIHIYDFIFLVLYMGFTLGDLRMVVPVHLEPRARDQIVVSCDDVGQVGSAVEKITR